VLERERVPATFFVVGSQVRGRGELLRRMLRDGSTIGNHTLSHANVAGAGPFATRQIAATQAIVRAATGYEPCLVRPPGGATSGALTRLVHSLGALSILWDVDPRDWSRPGAEAIAARVLGSTRPGSIVLLHDGGGDRSQTVAALPVIIRALRKRGLRLVTVNRLLGLRDHVAGDRAAGGAGT
jgi:peptidoglycan/xylan/chitin deacetylase (PgdA/CDA1 family)